VFVVQDLFYRSWIIVHDRKNHEAQNL